MSQIVLKTNGSCVSFIIPKNLRIDFLSELSPVCYIIGDEFVGAPAVGSGSSTQKTIDILSVSPRPR